MVNSLEVWSNKLSFSEIWSALLSFGRLTVDVWSKFSHS